MSMTSHPLIHSRFFKKSCHPKWLGYSLLFRREYPSHLGWGILIAYNLVRVEISRIAREAKVSPLRISFMMALRDIQDELMWCAIASPGSIPKKLRAMRERVKRYILPERKKRPKSRTVRMSKTRYPVRSKHVK